MTSTNNNNDQPSFLGKLVSVVVLLSAALFFTGWIYRWAYFGFFQLGVSRLNLPLESFYLAAFQALLGSPLTVLKTAIAFILTTGLILLTLQGLNTVVLSLSQKIPFRLNATQFDSIRFLRSLVDEIVIVLWVLFILFHLAKWQGQTDALTDAINETSTLPIVTFISRDENTAVGRKLDDPFPNPTNFRVIGDLGRYENLLTQDSSDPQQNRVWRLLLDGEGAVYLFPALPAKSDDNLRPPVLVVYESGNGDQMMIISPSVYK